MNEHPATFPVRSAMKYYLVGMDWKQDKWELFTYDGKPHGDRIKLTPMPSRELDYRSVVDPERLAITPQQAYDKAMIRQLTDVEMLAKQLLREQENLASLRQFSVNEKAAAVSEQP